MTYHNPTTTQQIATNITKLDDLISELSAERNMRVADYAETLQMDNQHSANNIAEQQELLRVLENLFATIKKLTEKRLALKLKLLEGESIPTDMLTAIYISSEDLVQAQPISDIPEVGTLQDPDTDEDMAIDHLIVDTSKITSA